MPPALKEIPIAQVAPTAGQAGHLVLAATASGIYSVLTAAVGGVSEDALLPLRFDHLVRSWKQGTRYTSSLSKIVMHPSYQAIIGMGPRVLPLILAELQRSGGHWFWALHAITQADPASEGDDYAATVHAWLAWGRARGYL